MKNQDSKRRLEIAVTKKYYMPIPIPKVRSSRTRINIIEAVTSVVYTAVKNKNVKKVVNIYKGYNIYKKYP
jgi:hypothetical protein